MEPGDPSLSDLLAAGRIDDLVERLLARYYDPLYRHGEQGRRIDARFDATDTARAAAEIVAWIEANPTEGSGAPAAAR